MDILLLLIFILVALYLAPLRGIPSFVFVSLSVVVLYSGGIFGALEPARLVLLIGFGIWSLKPLWDSRRVRPWHEPEALGFTFFALFLVYKLRAATLTHWDEFTAWGPFPLFLFRENHLTDSTVVAAVQNYPLAHPIFQYLFSWGSFREGVCYGAVTIWLVSALRLFLPRMTGDLRQRWIYTGLAVGIACFLNCATGAGWRSLYADQIFSATMGVALISGYALGRRLGGRWFVMLFLSAVFLLPQIKNIAVLGALTAVGFALLARWTSGGRFRVSDMVVPSLGLVGIVISLWTWKWYGETQGLAGHFKFQGDRIPHILAWSSDHEISALTRKATGLFLAETLWRPFDNVWPLSVWLLGMGVVGYRSFRERCLSVYVIVCTVLYLLALFASYLLFFGPFEAARLASYHRYASSFVMAAAMFWIWFAFRRGVKPLRLLPVLIFLVVGSTSRAWSFLIHDQAPRGDELAAEVEVLRKLAAAHPGASVWPLQTPGDTLTGWKLAYRGQGLVWKNVKCSSVRASDPHPYDCQFDRLPFGGVDYLFVYAADERFWKDYGAQFSCSGPCRPGLYRVTDLARPLDFF